MPTQKHTNFPTGGSMGTLEWSVPRKRFSFAYRWTPASSFLHLAEITGARWSSHNAIGKDSQTELLCWVASGNEPFSFARKKVEMRRYSCDWYTPLKSVAVTSTLVAFGQHQESRPPLGRSVVRSSRFTDFPATLRMHIDKSDNPDNLIGWEYQTKSLHMLRKLDLPFPEVTILGADQKERGLCEREWLSPKI